MLAVAALFRAAAAAPLPWKMLRTLLYGLGAAGSDMPLAVELVELLLL